MHSRAVPDTEAPPAAADRREPRSSIGIVAWCRARGPYARGFAAFLLFLVTSILVFALPVMGDLSHRCVGSCLPDTNLYVWAFDWMDHALRTGLDPLHTDYVWAPQGVSLAWVTSLPGPALLFRPITSRYGALVSVNLLMLLAPALAAWATYLLCVRLTRRFWASVMGGFVFGFSTYINQHERAQLNLILVFFVPLAVYLVVRRIDRSIGRIAFVVLLGVVLAGQFATSTEILATMTLFGALAYLIAVLTAPVELKKRLLATVPLLAAAYAAGAVIVSPIIFKLLRDAPPEHALRIPEINSTDLLSFVVPQSYAWFGGQTFASLSARFPVLPQNDTGYVSVILVGILIWFTIQFRKQWWALMLTSFTLLVAILSMGPKLHIAGRTYGDLPGALLQQLPLIEHATSDRFPLYLSLAMAVVVAIWVAAASGLASLFRIAAAGLGVVLLSVNLALEPTYHGTLAIPTFFTDGSYRTYIPGDSVVLGVPYQLGGDLRWQVATDFDFKLGRSYVGPVHPVGHLQASLGQMITAPNHRVPPPNAVRHFMTERGVRVVVAEEPVAPEIVSLFNDVLATEAVSSGGVMVWVVPPSGVTPSEPPPPEDVYTTAP